METTDPEVYAVNEAIEPPRNPFDGERAFEEPASNVVRIPAGAIRLDPRIKLENFFPCFDRIAVRVLPDAQFTEGGLEIPDKARDRPLQAEVLAVGPGSKETGPLPWKKGDIVIFQLHGGTDVDIARESIKMLRADEVMGTFGDLAPLPPAA